MKLLFSARAAAARLSRPLQHRLARLVFPPGTQPDDFLQPAGEAALLAPDSVSWRIFRNPVAMFVGGVTAVLLELAEPRVRSGVWEHTTFREQPLLRLQRTGYAAMMTVFGARSRTQAMIARINAGHARIEGFTPAGAAYRANDVELLTWVHATATFGFLQGYTTCVRAIDPADRDRFYRENQPVARLYGAHAPPASERELDALLERMQAQLEPSAIVLEFLAIVRRVELLPRPLRWLQFLLVRVAVQNLPEQAKLRLMLDGAVWRVPPCQRALVRLLGRIADHLTLPTLPAMLAKERLATKPAS
jgi:uncharacterized protein (DUF2236 family)